MKNYFNFLRFIFLFFLGFGFQSCQVSVSVTEGDQASVPPVLPPPPNVPSLNEGGYPTGKFSKLSNGAEIWGRVDNISTKKILSNGVEIEAMLPTDSAMGVVQ